MKLSHVNSVTFKTTAVLLVMSLGLAVTAATNDTIADLPCRVPFEVGDVDFQQGDSITINQVRGTKDLIRVGEKYCVEGTYTLTSRDKADIALFATTLTKVAVPTDASQIMRVEKGTGTFRLIKTMREDGFLHVSFYPVPGGGGFGGIYFGQGKWVLRNKDFSYLNGRTQSQGFRWTPSPSSGQVSLEGPNRVLLEYLGDPVQPPDDMDTAYTKDGLIEAIQTAARKAGIVVKRVEIEDSEYPFLVGVVCKEGDYDKLTSQIRKMSAYEYCGSVGSHACHAMNIVPYRAYPAEASQRISHRTTLRQQVFFDKIIALR